MNTSTDDLRSIALDIREHIIRLSLEQEFGVHVGGSLSLTEILTVLYFAIARVDPQNPEWSKRDRIVLSKGHGNAGLLIALALRGFFSLEVLKQFNQIGSYFSMHADAHIPGIEHSAGSLGHGLSVAVGMALAARLDGESWHAFCILGDGESMEGSVWEAMMSASSFHLDNLTAIIDRNFLTQENTIINEMGLEPLIEKCRAFGWEAYEVDGHSIEELLKAFRAPHDGYPKMIIARTIKGRGVPSHENKIESHFAHLKPEEAAAALSIIHQEREC